MRYMPETVEAFLDTPWVPLELVRHEPYDFLTGAPEQTITIIVASRKFFNDPRHFWIKSLEQRLDWPDRVTLIRYALGATAEPLDEHQFHERTDHLLQSLREPRTLTLNGEFRSASKLIDRPDDVALLAETTLEYIAFFWEAAA